MTPIAPNLPATGPLQEWFDPRIDPMKESELYFKESWREQIMFVRDWIVQLLSEDCDFEERRRGGSRQAQVISTHGSKSTELPVYHIVGDHMEVWLRGNYYDWKVSVRSAEPVQDIMMKRLITSGYDKAISPVYFEGFEPEWIFGSYLDNPREFSIEGPYHEEPFYTLMYLLTEQFRDRGAA